MENLQGLLIISPSGGPVIEQGTHFCDLSRYFGGDVDIQTVQAHALVWDEAPGKLSKIGIDESKVDPSKRIPRVTTANWWVVRFHFGYERETEFRRLTTLSRLQEIQEWRCWYLHSPGFSPGYGICMRT